MKNISNFWSQNFQKIGKSENFQNIKNPRKTNKHINFLENFQKNQKSEKFSKIRKYFSWSTLLGAPGGLWQHSGCLAIDIRQRFARWSELSAAGGSGFVVGADLALFSSHWRLFFFLGFLMFWKFSDFPIF